MVFIVASSVSIVQDGKTTTVLALYSCTSTVPRIDDCANKWASMPAVMCYAECLGTPVPATLSIPCCRGTLHFDGRAGPDIWRAMRTRPGVVPTDTALFRISDNSCAATLTNTYRGTQLTSGVGTTNGWRNNNNYSVAIILRNQPAASQPPRKRCCPVVCERANNPLNCEFVLSRESVFGFRHDAFISKVGGSHHDDVDPNMSLRTKNTRYNHILSRVNLHKDKVSHRQRLGSQLMNLRVGQWIFFVPQLGFFLTVP